MVPERYVWLAWSSLFLVPWLALFMAFPAQRRAMWWTSLFTTPFGLTEPLFVPEYWNPPSLFDLASRTGFDIESLIFCFGIGGVGAVSYSIVSGTVSHPVPQHERASPRHRHHMAALATPFVLFPPLYLLPWNPIYPGIASMGLGTAATLLCRPDLLKKTWIGGLLFLVYYIILLTGLEWTAPGYIERVWNLGALSGIVVARFPLEELLFALAFGCYWSGVYEHFKWHTVGVRGTS